MTIQSITAVYQQGMLKPLQPLSLAENEQVEIQIIRSSATPKKVLKLSGILQGFGDATYEEIEAITKQVEDERWQNILTHLEDVS